MNHALAAQRIGAKVYVNSGGKPLDLEPAIGVFHRWIQQGRLENTLMLDVADYRHVAQGPGVMLICHAGHYALDTSDGQLGLLYQGMRAVPQGFGSQLKGAVVAALQAAQLLQDEPETAAFRFANDGLVLRIQDRLLAPNTTETLKTTRPIIDALATAMYGTAAFEIAQLHDDARRCFAVRLRVREPRESPDLPTLLARARAWAPL